MMEYPSKYDFFLSFRTIFNNEGHFVDYILVDTSSNFQSITNIKVELILGKRLSEIVMEYDEDIFGIKDIYYNMIPKVKRKFEKYIEELNRWYFISIFSNNYDELILFYNDISKIRNPKESAYARERSKAYAYNSERMQDCFGYKDKLTNLYNRNFFEEELSRIDSSKQLPLSIIMGDLSGLKLINDAFSHEMGDEVLKKVAKLMKSAFRKEDIISRIGGDEFAILLPKTSETTALSMAKKIQNDCDTYLLDFIKISISFGVATKENVKEDIYKVYREAEERMYFNKVKKSKETKLSIIKYLKDKLEEVSFETKAHNERLKNLCIMMCDKIGMSEIEKERLKLLCEFHDIGQVGISPNILRKKGSLNNDEWERVRRHSEIGYRIIGASKNTMAIDELILVHHERWDGKGYPGLLKNNDIPLTARIFIIADAYEAMVNDRPYKNRINNKEALKEINNNAGTQFDPYLAKVFIEIMDQKSEEILKSVSSYA